MPAQTNAPHLPAGRCARRQLAITQAALCLVFTLTMSMLAAVPRPAEAGRILQPGQSATGDNRPVVYLAFDGGPGQVSSELLDALDLSNGKVTFFVSGSRTQADPDTVSQVVDRGHALANHTWDHPDMSKLSRYEATVQFVATQRIVEAATGITMTCWRPPFGESNDQVQGWADELGLTNSDPTRTVDSVADTINWDSSYDVVLAQLNTIQPNDVVLMHGGMNPDLKVLTTWLEANGDRYRLEALPGCAPPNVNESKVNPPAAEATSPVNADLQSTAPPATGPAGPAPVAELKWQPNELAFADPLTVDGATSQSAAATNRWFVRQRTSVFLSLVSKGVDPSSLAGSSE